MGKRHSTDRGSGVESDQHGRYGVRGGEDNDLAKLRKLAKVYEALTEQRVDELIDEGSWMEICHDEKSQVQE
jgi:hypothetical protein